jgi:hypothetical protein
MIDRLRALQAALQKGTPAETKTVLLENLKAAHDARSRLSARRPKRS